MNNKISVLIGSCDSYSKFWHNFNILFDRYWKISTKNIFVTETKNVPYDKYITSLGGSGKSWGSRILSGLELIDTEYTFFILEDYYFTTTISEDFISKNIEALEKYSAQKILFDDPDPSCYKLNSLEDNLFIFDNNSQYLNSVQPAIWKTSYLKSVLKPEYSPWDFEIKGNSYTKSLDPTILLRGLSKPIYFNFVRVGGKLSSGWQSLLDKEGLTINDQE